MTPLNVFTARKVDRPTVRAGAGPAVDPCRRRRDAYESREGRFHGGDSSRPRIISSTWLYTERKDGARTGAPPVPDSAVTTLLRRPLLGQSEDAVASTVGTIMALLVFLTFLSLITNQYVPVWMKDAEATHMSDALGQFGEFKSSLDLQILAAHTSLLADEPYVPVTTFTSVKVGVDGVPIFATPTIGNLRMDQEGSRWSVNFTYNLGGNTTLVPESECGCGGSVRLRVFNRFYLAQSIAYENGAIIRSQDDGQVVKGQPAFRVGIIENTSASVDFRLIELFEVGSGDVTGVGAEGLQARLIGLDLQEYTSIQTAIEIRAETLHGPAWYRFFNETLARAYGITTEYYGDFPAESDLIADYAPDGRAVQLTANNPVYLVHSLWDAASGTYELIVSFKLDDLGDSIDVLPVSAFRILHAYVNVEVGAL